MRTLLCGGVMGLLVGAAVTGALWTTDRVALEDKVLAVVIAVGVTTTLWWVVGAFRAFRRRVRTFFHQRRVRKQRRRELAAARANVGTPVFDPLTDDETVLMTGSRGRSRLGRAQIATFLLEAEAATLRGDFHGAAERYSDVIDSSPEHVAAHLARGRVWLALGDYNRAMSDFVTAEDLAPDSPEPPDAIGELYFARKDYVRAISSYDVVLALAPDHAMALCRRGLSHHYRKCHALALDDLLKARVLDPDIPNLGSHIAAVQRKVKEEAAIARGNVKAKRR